MSKISTPIACNMAVLTKAESLRHKELIELVMGSCQEQKELPDGYNLAYPLKPDLFAALSE